MKRLFEIDSPIYRFMSTLLNVLVLNICWLLGSLPIFTIGISTIAACDVGLKMVEDKEGYVARQFLIAYKKNMKQGLILGIMALISTYAIYLDVQLVRVMADPSVFMIMGSILSIVVCVIGLLYTFPLAARYDNSIPNMIKNSFRISTKYFVRTILLILLLIVEALAFSFNLTLFFIGVLIGPACMILTTCLIARPIFRKIEKDNGVETDEEGDN